MVSMMFGLQLNSITRYSYSHSGYRANVVDNELTLNRYKKKNNLTAILRLASVVYITSIPCRIDSMSAIATISTYYQHK